jgi:hypothetical protein
MGDTAGGNWENYYFAGENMHVANLYLNNFIVPPWILDNHEFDTL